VSVSGQGAAEHGELDLVAIAHAADAAEGGAIQGRLEGAGIPSLLQLDGTSDSQVGVGRLPAGDGPRRVMVRASRAEEARAVLARGSGGGDAEGGSGPAGVEPLAAGGGAERSREQRAAVAYARVHLWLLGGMAIVLGIFLLLRFV
jgi:hypothetical protein